MYNILRSFFVVNQKNTIHHQRLNAERTVETSGFTCDPRSQLRPDIKTSQLKCQYSVCMSDTGTY